MKHLIIYFILLLALMSCSKEEINEDAFGPPLITCDSFKVHIEVLEFPSEKRAELGVKIIENGEAPFSYEWSTNDTTSTITVTSDGQYILSVTDANGCIDIVELLVDYIDHPCVDFSARIEEIERGNLVAVSTGGKAPYHYEWSNGQTGSEIMVTQDGRYTVTVTDKRDCRKAASINVRFFDPCSSLKFLSYKYNPITEELSVTITGGNTPYRYEWSTGETTPTIIAEEGISYILIVTDSQNCELIIDLPLPE